MKMIFIYTVVISLIKIFVSQVCFCPTRPQDAPNTLQNPPKNYTLQDEFINGVNYGKPVVVAGHIFLRDDFNVSASTRSLIVTCPQGYRPPTIEEMRDLLNEDVTTLTEETGLRMKPGMYYISGNKTYANFTSGKDNQAWIFKSVSIDETGAVIEEKDTNTYWEKQMATKCLYDPKTLLTLVTSQYDLVAGYSYAASILDRNMFSFTWKVDEAVYSNQSISVNFNSTGCYLIEAWTKDIANNTHYGCVPVHVVPPFGSDGESTYDGNTIRSIDLKATSKYISNFFFQPSNSPLAPKLDGGMYIFYASSSDGSARVIELDERYDIVSNTRLGFTCQPMDIVATEWGFAIYFRNDIDINRAFLIGYNSDYSLRFNRTIMNNGNAPTKANKDQLIFYEKEGTPQFGMNAMFRPQMGKLAWARGRLALIFSHYNFFGFNKDGSRSEHTGDSFVTFDDKGRNEKCGWSWFTSHSLVQTVLFDGRQFVTASLGDLFPENIKVCLIDPLSTNSRSKYYDPVRKGYFNYEFNCTDIVPDKIPGDGQGYSCGRFGGLFKLGQTYAVVYSIKPCSLAAYDGDGQTETNLNEIGFVTFNIRNNQVENIKKTVFNNEAKRLNNLRAAKYGDKIFVTFSIQEKDPGKAAAQNNYRSGDVMYTMLVGFDGKVYAEEEMFIPFAMNTAEDMRFLKDGSVAWAAVDRETGNMNLYYTKMPQQKLIIDLTSVPILPNSTMTNNSTNTTTDKDNSGSFNNLAIGFIFILIGLFY